MKIVEIERKTANWTATNKVVTFLLTRRLGEIFYMTEISTKKKYFIHTFFYKKN